MKLRLFQPEDASVILTWVSDEAAFRKWTADRYPAYPITPEDMIRNYASSGTMGKEDPHFFQAVTMINEEGTPRGSMILRRPDETDLGHIRFGFIIVDSSIRGKGYGKKMLNLAKEYAKEELGANKLSLGVFDNNDPARHCYESVGFIDNGESEDCICMGETWTFRGLEMKI